MKKTSRVRAVTVVLLVLLFVAAAVFMFLSDVKAPESLYRKKAPFTTVYTLNEALEEPESQEIPGEEEAGPSKLDYRFGIEDATGLGSVRASNIKVGVDYKLTENTTVEVEASQGVHDSQDAAAWGKSVEDETAAQAKYKIAF